MGESMLKKIRKKFKTANPWQFPELKPVPYFAQIQPPADLICSDYNFFTFICFHRKDTLITMILPLSLQRRTVMLKTVFPMSNHLPITAAQLTGSRSKVFTGGPICTFSFISHSPSSLHYYIWLHLPIERLHGKGNKQMIPTWGQSFLSFIIWISIQKVLIQYKLLNNTVVTTEYVCLLTQGSHHLLDEIKYSHPNSSKLPQGSLGTKTKMS